MALKLHHARNLLSSSRQELCPADITPGALVTHLYGLSDALGVIVSCGFGCNNALVWWSDASMASLMLWLHAGMNVIVNTSSQRTISWDRPTVADSMGIVA